MPIKRRDPQPTGVRGIKKDGPDRFLVCTTWRDPRTGKERRREGVATSLAKAVKLKEKLRTEDLEKEMPTRMRFSDYAERWIEERANELAPSTRERYATSLAHLSVAFGTYWLDAIQPADVRKWQSKALASRKPATINGWLRVMRQMLSTAQQDGLVGSNVARAVKTLREGRTGGRRGRSLTAEQFAKFYSTLRSLTEQGEIEEDLERMLIAAGWSGMRRGELYALRFEDVIDGELHIVRAVWKRTEKETKTDDPRVIAFVGPLALAIEAQRAWLMRVQHPGLQSGLVFPASPRQALAGARRRGVDELSWFRAGSCLTDPIENVVEAAGLPAISLHSFRRTYENLLRQAGVDDLVRRSLAGWRTETAQTIYAGVADGERKAAVIAMESLVEQAKAKLRPELRPGQKTEVD